LPAIGFSKVMLMTVTHLKSKLEWIKESAISD
jgi:hypothetical protein